MFSIQNSYTKLCVYKLVAIHCDIVCYLSRRTLIIRSETGFGERKNFPMDLGMFLKFTKILEIQVLWGMV